MLSSAIIKKVKLNKRHFNYAKKIVRKAHRKSVIKESLGDVAKTSSKNKNLDKIR